MCKNVFDNLLRLIREISASVTLQYADMIFLVEMKQIHCFTLHHHLALTQAKYHFNTKQPNDISLTSEAVQGHLPASHFPPGSHWSISRRNDTCKHSSNESLPGYSICSSKTCVVVSLMLPVTLHHGCCRAVRLTGRQMEKKCCSNSVVTTGGARGHGESQSTT